LYKAINEIDKKLRRFKIRAYTKEKYGTMRMDFLGYWDGTIYYIFYHNHCYIKKNWHWFYFNIDLKIIQPFFVFIRLVKLINMIQNWYIKKVFKESISKYPEIKDELLSDTSYIIDFNTTPLKNNKRTLRR
jgi:hypothetical protein